MYMRVVNIVVNNYMCITVCWLEGQNGLAYSIQYRYTHFALLSFMIFFRVFNSSSVLGWFGFSVLVQLSLFLSIVSEIYQKQHQHNPVKSIWVLFFFFLQWRTCILKCNFVVEEITNLKETFLSTQLYHLCLSFWL